MNSKTGPSFTGKLIAAPHKAVRVLGNLFFVAALFTGGDLLAVGPAPDVKATQKDAFPAHPDNRAREGDVITYTTIISNVTGTANATGVQLANPPPGNTTDVAGSVTISPLAFPDAFVAGKNTPLSVAAAQGLLSNDTGTPLPTVTGISTPACADVTTPFNCTTPHGTIALNADGSFTYNPANNYLGADMFTYTVTNANSPDDSATVTITVVDVPIANPDTYPANKDAILTVPATGVLGNDTLNSATITSYGLTGTEQTAIGSPTATNQGGMVSLNADGGLSYTPATGFTGNDTFSYTITNPAGSSLAAVTFAIACQVITVTNPATTTGTVNAPFSQMFTQSGGAGATTFSLIAELCRPV